MPLLYAVSFSRMCITAQMAECYAIGQKKALPSIHWPSLERHIIGTERIKSSGHTKPVQYLNNVSHEQNLSSASGEPEFVSHRMKFFKIPASGRARKILKSSEYGSVYTSAKRS